MNNALEHVLSRLQGVRRSGGRYIALCPAHNDNKASLSISAAEDRVLLKCFADCENEAVVKALGLQMNDLFDHSPKEFGNGKKPGSYSHEKEVYDYTDADGNLIYQVVRFEPKDFRQRRPDGNGGWIWNLQSVNRVLYRLPKLKPAISKGEMICVVEGEKDVHSLESVGLTATCNAGGAGKWQESFAEYLKKASVVLLPDNDEPGRKHAENVAQSLNGFAASVKVVELPGLPPKGDVSDWLQAGHTVEDLHGLVEQAQEWKSEQSKSPQDQARHGAITVLSKFYPRPFTKYILERVQFVWEGERGLLWRYDGGEGLWRSDGGSFISAYFRRDLEDILDDLKRKNVVQEIIADVAGCSYQPGGLHEPSLHLIPFANGVYDLNAGGFREFRADDLFTFKLPHRYNPAAKARYLPEVIGNLLPEAETVTLYELIAYCLWRDYPYQKVFFLLGGGGNGKSLFTQTILSHFLGKENVTQTGLQSLQEERFATAQLYRKLANVAGESPYCDLKDTETLKALCGWDVLEADRKYLATVKFKNHAKLIFVCNQLPKTHDTTDAFYRRPFIVEFPNQFQDDPTLPIRITGNPEEFEWLAAQAVRTLQDLRGRNFIFTRHQGLDRIKAEYERRSNPLVRFIAECCIRDSDGLIWKWEFCEKYQDFLKENGFVTWSDTRLGGDMKQLGYETGKRTGSEGREWNAWLGITWLNPPESQDSQGYLKQSSSDIRDGCKHPGDPGDPCGNNEPSLRETIPTASCPHCGAVGWRYEALAFNNNGGWICRKCFQAIPVEVGSNG